MKKKKLLEIILLIFLGALSSLSLPPYNFFLINFLTFSSFFIFLFRKLKIQNHKKMFFLYGWLFGFGYFSTNLYWITISLSFDPSFNYLIPFALILIPAFLALFYGLVTLGFYLINLQKLLSSFFLFSLFFGFTEFVRGNILTGFPWNLIVYSFSKNLNFISFISLIGTYSLNLFVISLFSVPAIYILRKSKKDILVFVIIILLPIIFVFYGYLQKQKFINSNVKDNSYTIRVIGSNIGLDRFYKDIKADEVINELIKISSTKQNKKMLFIWPEGIIPGTYQDELKLYSDLFSKNFNEDHLIGLGITSRLSYDFDYKYFNSFSIFDNNLKLIHEYRKIKLVPFGEFLPFEKILYKFGLETITTSFGSFNEGDKRNIIQLMNNSKELKILPLICYEIIYSGDLTKNFDFDVILNISEDGWFGKSIGPKQHFTHSIFRAIESGKYVIRSSNNGIAAIINPLGEIEQKIDYGKIGYLDFDKRRDIELTLFSKYGNKIFIILILLYIFLIFSFNRFGHE